VYPGIQYIHTYIYTYIHTKTPRYIQHNSIQKQLNIFFIHPIMWTWLSINSKSILSDYVCVDFLMLSR
jgi:hypothetical protein